MLVTSSCPLPLSWLIEYSSTILPLIQHCTFGAVVTDYSRTFSHEVQHASLTKHLFRAQINTKLSRASSKLCSPFLPPPPPPPPRILPSSSTFSLSRTMLCSTFLYRLYRFFYFLFGCRYVVLRRYHEWTSCNNKLRCLRTGSTGPFAPQRIFSLSLPLFITTNARAFVKRFCTEDGNESLSLWVGFQSEADATNVWALISIRSPIIIRPIIWGEFSLGRAIRWAGQPDYSHIPFFSSSSTQDGNGPQLFPSRRRFGTRYATDQSRVHRSWNLNKICINIFCA